MGRKKEVLTEMEAQERKARWFGPERNARRRAKYQSDKEYREQTLRRLRVGVDNSVVTTIDSRDNIPRLAEFGAERDVILPSGEVRRMLCLTSDELARFLGRDEKIIGRWQADGRWPAGVLRIRINGKTLAQVYSGAEVVAMAQAFGPHQVETPYYLKKHTDTRERVFSAVAAVREKMGIKHDGSDSSKAA